MATTTPFHYVHRSELAHMNDRFDNNNAYKTVINWTWGDSEDFCTWVIQPNDVNTYGSFGDYIQLGLDLPDTLFVLANKNSPAVRVATKFNRVGGIVSEMNDKNGIYGRMIASQGKSLGSVTVYKPECDDPNFVGIGLVFGRPDEPPVGEYYCVHKSYIQDGGPIPNNRKSALRRDDPSAGANTLGLLGFWSPLSLATTNTHLLTIDKNGIVLIDDVKDNTPRFCNVDPASADFNVCLSYCSKNQGACDDVIEKYCKLNDNQDKDICACLNSPVESYNPYCIDNRCSSVGYTTREMTQLPCPSVIDCRVVNEIAQTGRDVQFKDVTIDQRCGSQANNKQDSGTPLGVMSDTRINKNILWIAVAIIACLLAFIIYLLWSRTGSSVNPSIAAVSAISRING